MDVTEIGIYPGSNRSERLVDGRKNVYTGPWNLLVKTPEKHFHISLLVPGEGKTQIGELVRNDAKGWPVHDYLLEMFRYDVNDPNAEEKNITPEEAQELKSLLGELNLGKKEALNVFGNPISQEQVQEITNFLSPRLSIASEKAIEGQRSILYRDIEPILESQQEARELPPTSRA